ncbi:MAG: methyltransferase, partial [Acetobacteraceae bacterium]|nr:methyltransferase [Acetobacteraceae bacterium]
AAIACALAGARSEAAEVDPVAVASIRLNAALNSAQVTALAGDVVGQPCRWDLILCGDICYEAPMTRHILPWLRGLAGSAEVWIADPGRAYMPASGLELLDSYNVPTSIELEDRPQRTTRVYRLLPEG